LSWNRRTRKTKHNSRATVTQFGYFHSEMELAHYQNLLLRKAAGEITSEIERQVFFNLRVNDEPICQIKPDFRYTKRDALRPTIDEVKGFPERDWIIKWKLLQALYKDEYEFVLTRKGDIY
jgi:hypothetical protein